MYKIFVLGLLVIVLVVVSKQSQSDCVSESIKNLDAYIEQLHAEQRLPRYYQWKAHIQAAKKDQEYREDWVFSAWQAVNQIDILTNPRNNLNLKED